MLEDISEYQAIEHAFSESRTPLFARKRLLAMLLARRREERGFIKAYHHRRLPYARHGSFLDLVFRDRCRSRCG